MLACLVGLLGGCALSTRLTTNQARDYKGNPRRIYVVFHSVDEYGPTFDRTFIAKSSQLAKDCGAALEGTTITGLELDKNAYLVAVKAFNPDTVLVLRRAGGTKTEFGQLLYLLLNIELVDVPANRIVWRAKADFHRGSSLIPIEQRAEALATDITGRLKADGILKCPEGGSV
jgi:hypothetical protein